MKNEIWKDIKGYEGRYQVSNLGRIKSLMFVNNIVCKPKETIRRLNYSKKHNRYYVDLRLNGKRKHLSVHRLVAETFLENPNNYPVINHKDGDPTNNNVNNLEWCTSSYNSKHAYDNGLCKAFELMNEKNKKPVIRSDGKIYPSVRAAALDLGVITEGVRSCLKGRQKTCRGYSFNYAENEEC